MGIRPSNTAGPRLSPWTFDFLLSRSLSHRAIEKETVHVLLDGPVESVESKDTHVLIKATVSAARQEELNELRHVPAKERCLLQKMLTLGKNDHKNLTTHQDKEGLEDIEELARSFLVRGLHALTDDLDHAREESLE
jgi:hypothetical protein